MGHLLQIRGDVWIVPGEMRVVKDDGNYMLNLATGRIELATAPGRGRPNA